jgi:gas vesicle protein
MNAQIKTDLGNGSFKPKVEDWPKYNIPIKEIGQKKLSEVIKPWLDGTAKEPLTALSMKTAFYPEPVAAVITESYVLESGQAPQIQAPQAQPANVGKGSLAAKNVKANANALLQSKIDAPKKFEPDSENGKKLQNFFLFGKPDASNANYSNELTPELWEDTINNIVNCDKAITVGIKEITADIKSTSDELKQKLNALNENIETQMQAAGNDREATDRIVPQQNKVTVIEDLIKIVTEISNEYGIGFASSMQNAFFVTSYKLYSDIIKKYKDASGSFEQQQPNANAQPAAPAQPAANAQAQPA